MEGATKTAVHFPGAKHHAQYDYSSGFCVFADFALAADIATKDYGKKVAILDIDAHHGDGTENLTADNPSILTYSIHEKGIFPGTGNESDLSRDVYNAPLASRSGDDALLHAVMEFAELTQHFGADLIFVACGADAHAEDPLSSLTYSTEGYRAVAQYLREVFPNHPILMGGAGGYLPDTRTPEVWSSFAHALNH